MWVAFDLTTGQLYSQNSARMDDVELATLGRGQLETALPSIDLFFNYIDVSQNPPVLVTPKPSPPSPDPEG